MDAKKIYKFLKLNKEVPIEHIQKIQEAILELVDMKPLPYTMRPRQIQAIISFICLKNDISVFLPTSYGKTIVSIVCGKYMEKIHNKKTVMIGLLKALTAEHKDTFNEYAPTIISDGDHSKTDFENDWTFCILTPEKFDNIISNSNRRDDLMNDVGLIITDEAHNISDESRGYRMENYIITSKRIDQLNKNIFGIDEPFRHIRLSATVGNPEKFSNWGNTDLIFAKPEERPVPLKLEIIGYEELFYGWDKTIPNVKANYKRRIQILRNIIKSNPNKNWLIFTTSRKRTQSVCYDIKGINTKISLETLMESYKIAYHNAGLSKKQRENVEEAFKVGDIKVIVSTPTLAVGVNLPADCTVLFDIEQYSALRGNEILDSNRIQQTMGRAGRAGLSEFGYSYIITPNRIYEEVEKRAKNPLIVKSQLQKRLHQAILKWFVAGVVTTIDDIIETTSFSFGSINKEEILNAINFLITFNFIENIDDDKYSVTEKGYDTSIQDITPETVVKWEHQVNNIKNPDDLKELFVRIASCKEYCDTLTVRKEDESVLSYGESELGSFFPKYEKPDCICTLCTKNGNCKKISKNNINCDDYEPCYTELIPPEVYKGYFLTFYNDLAEKYLPKKFNKYSGKIEIKHLPIQYIVGDRTLLKNNGSRLFNASAVIFKRKKTITTNLQIIAKLIMGGTLKKEIVDLCKLERIGIKKANLLYKAGIRTIQKFLECNKYQISKILDCSVQSAQNLINENLNF